MRGKPATNKGKKMDPRGPRPPEVKVLLSRLATERAAAWTSEQHAEASAKAKSAYANKTDEEKQAFAAKMSDVYNARDPAVNLAFMKAGAAVQSTPENRAIKSAQMKAYWAALPEDKRREWADNLQASLPRILPNKTESVLMDMFPTELKFTGDRSLMLTVPGWGKIGIKNPDFVVEPFDQTHKVIEVFGEHVHTEEEADRLIEAYRVSGVECLIVWGRFLKRKLRRPKVKNLVSAFISNDLTNQAALSEQLKTEVKVPPSQRQLKV